MNLIFDTESSVRFQARQSTTQRCTSASLRDKLGHRKGNIQCQNQTNFDSIRSQRRPHSTQKPSHIQPHSATFHHIRQSGHTGGNAVRLSFPREYVKATTTFSACDSSLYNIKGGNGESAVSSMTCAPMLLLDLFAAKHITLSF